jgi:hypothetical protein
MKFTKEDIRELVGDVFRVLEEQNQTLTVSEKFVADWIENDYTDLNLMEK